MRNLVVSTNEGAIRLWTRHGSEVVGTLPGAFRDPDLGCVDAFVMFKTLREGRDDVGKFIADEETMAG